MKKIMIIGILLLIVTLVVASLGFVLSDEKIEKKELEVSGLKFGNIDGAAWDFCRHYILYREDVAFQMW